VGFRFRLSTVADHRRRVEEARALVLADACRRRDAAVARLHVLEGQRRACREALAAALAGGAAGSTLALLVRTVDTADLRSREAAREVLDVEAEVEQARRALVDAARDRQVIQRAYELARARYLADVERLEQKTLDDIGTVTHVRQAHEAAASDVRT
jgi:flagellar FliJ protein